jgi:hypothetical protein
VEKYMLNAPSQIIYELCGISFSLEADRRSAGQEISLSFGIRVFTTAIKMVHTGVYPEPVTSSSHRHTLFS